MTEFAELKAKTYAYLINGYNDDDFDKKKIINEKAKVTKKCVIECRLMLENFINSLFNDKIILKSQKRFKSHNVYIEQINKISLSSNDDKGLQTFDKITTYPYGTNAIKVCESEMLRVFEAKAKLKMLSKECEIETYVKEKEKCEMFLKYVKTKCESEMRKYVKLKKIASCFATYK